MTPRAGMGLLYYGQNFLIYPSAFPAGARESVLPLHPLARPVLTTMCDPPLYYGGWFHPSLMIRRPRPVRLFGFV